MVDALRRRAEAGPTVCGEDRDTGRVEPDRHLGHRRRREVGRRGQGPQPIPQGVRQRRQGGTAQHEDGLSLHRDRPSAVRTLVEMPARAIAGHRAQRPVGVGDDGLVRQVLARQAHEAGSGTARGYSGSTGRTPGARWAKASLRSTRPRWMRERTVPTLMPKVAAISS